MNRYMQIAQDSAWHSASPLSCQLLLLSLLSLPGVSETLKNFPQGHGASKQQLVHSVSSLIFPTVNILNSSQHRSVLHGAMSVFSLTTRWAGGWGPLDGTQPQASYLSRKQSPRKPPPAPCLCYSETPPHSPSTAPCTRSPTVPLPPAIISDSSLTFCLCPLPPDPKVP